MTEVRPFRALRFARDPGPRIAPPYDVISAEERERFAAEPENVVHLTLPPGAEGARDYAAAAETLRRWLEQGVLERDATERLYTLSETTTSGSVRRGIFGLLRLADYGAGVVLPHERTMPGPKRDRLLLTRATRANLEPLLFLYDDREGKTAPLIDLAAEAAPLASCRGPDGTGLELHALEAAGATRALLGFLAERPVVIADGHHRYETMLRYRDEVRGAGEPVRGAGEPLGGAADPQAAPHEYVLAYLVNAFDPGTEVRAIHRVLTGRVADPEQTCRRCGFSLERLDATLGADQLLAMLGERAASAQAFAIVTPEGGWLATRPRGERLDVELLHEELLPELGGELSFDARPARTLERVRSGQAALGILLNPLPAADLFRVVEAGALLPQKSTYFSPKVPSGLVLRDF